MSVTMEPTAVVLQPAAQAIARARALGRNCLVTITQPISDEIDPLAMLAAASNALGDGVLWWSQGSGDFLCGAGIAFGVDANGSGRFGAVRDAIVGLNRAILNLDPTTPFPVFAGFAFDEQAPDSRVWSAFPGARVVAPRVLLARLGGALQLRVTEQVAPSDSAEELARRLERLANRARHWAASRRRPGSRQSSVPAQVAIPDRVAWESSVKTAVSLINQSHLEKVVLAREVRLFTETPFDPLEVLSHLGRNADGATLFALQRGRSWFVGATPERLVRLDGSAVEVTCLAGSIGVGQTERERQDLAQALLRSDKDRSEHEFVVQSTIDALSEVCQEVQRAPGTPWVTPARSVQHLASPITATLSAAGSVLDLVERLHPTPAVGGFPAAPALHAIRELEQFDRGWYAGPVGWLDLSGSGEFSVAIRSAIVSGTTASAFAGAGIVRDSVAEREYAETELKLKPMLSALGAV